LTPRQLKALGQRWTALAGFYGPHGATGQRVSRAGNNGVVGTWNVTVYVDGPSAPFDTLYLFNRDGGFIRIDGRNDVPGLGAWKQNPDGRVNCTFVLFSFDAAGRRVGTITAPRWVASATAF
jgi:hypothetical protein